MVKTLILLRHGQSEADKNNPKRKLTPVGKTQIKRAARSIRLLIDGKKSLIITTQTTRTRKSARILSKILGVQVRETRLELRVKNFDLIEKKFKKVKNLSRLYLNDFSSGNLDKRVSKPTQIVANFLKLLGRLDQEIAIIVGHGAALETFALYQTQFRLTVPYITDLRYGEFIVLERD